MVFKTIISNIYNDNSTNFKHKLKLLPRILIHWKLQKDMQLFFESLQLKPILSKHSRFYNKFSRPYIQSNLTNQKKIFFIKAHYTYLDKIFHTETILKIYNKSILLFDFAPYDIDMKLTIKYIKALEREGEIAFNLSNSNKIPIYSISGTFANNNFYISAIQGYKDLELIKKYTKKCYGMRPHNLLYFAILQICKTLGIQEIYAITNEDQVFNEKKTKKKVLFDYEVFFKDIYTANIIQKDGWFHLDTNYPLKQIDEIKSKKRSMYKKRYHLLDNMSQNISKKLIQLKK